MLHKRFSALCVLPSGIQFSRLPGVMMVEEAKRMNNRTRTDGRAMKATSKHDKVRPFEGN
ncbi:hypothetical protein HPP92_016122 [Vanilla planifolia]|uniref:Uncharacterized protein n=1 Tax=Vanilla planifolia TaxID=51239 RepID=A0A835QE74_VANPL|nr:hypothetical protein HPP92_016122 [Vanilla planifolia]